MVDNVSPFDFRSYGMYGFLAGVRNYSHAPVIAKPKGIPDDLSPEVRDAWDEGRDGFWHTPSWLTVAEMQALDYDTVFWDRRITKQEGPNSWNGAALAEEGEGEHLPLRDFLPVNYFRDLDALATLGSPENVRVVFWFDN